MSQSSTPPPVRPVAMWAIERAGSQLAKVLAHPLRLLIVARLNERPMSPAEFCELHPDVPLQTVARHFRVLAEVGCIELVALRQPNDRSRGAARHVYRAVDRPIFEQAELEALGDQKRHVTGVIFKTFIRRLAEAIAASTFSSRSDTHFSWVAGRLDERGWRAMLDAVDALFWHGLKLHTEAGVRVAESGGELIPVTVGLSCFLTNGELMAEPTQREKSGGELSIDDAERSLDAERIKVFANPTRAKIISELSKGPISPSDFHVRHPQLSLQTVTYHFHLIEKIGLIALAERRSGRGRRPGGVENIYELNEPWLVDAETYDALPASLRHSVDSVSVITYVEILADSIRTDAIEERDESHLTWCGFHFDEIAWAEMIIAMDALLQCVLELRRRSEARLVASGDEGLPVVAGLSCFESPPASTTFDREEMERLRAETSESRLSRLSRYLDEILKRFGERPPS